MFLKSNNISETICHNKEVCLMDASCVIAFDRQGLVYAINSDLPYQYHWMFSTWWKVLVKGACPSLLCVSWTEPLWYIGYLEMWLILDM